MPEFGNESVPSAVRPIELLRTIVVVAACGRVEVAEEDVVEVVGDEVPVSGGRPAHDGVASPSSTQTPGPWLPMSVLPCRVEADVVPGDDVGVGSARRSVDEHAGVIVGRDDVAVARRRSADGVVVAALDEDALKLPFPVIPVASVPM